MRRTLIFLLLLLVTAGQPTLAQVPLDIHVTILKAEDSRSFDEPLAALFKHKDVTVRSRAALAAGRIGNARAVPALTELLLNDDSPDVRVMAVFALGEIESAEAAEAVNRAAIDPKAPPDIRARALEAAGKIVAANAEDPRMTVLKESIVRVLNIQSKDSAIQNTSVIRAGLTAVLRARPDGGEDAVKPFLAHSSPEGVADALNTLARLRSKAANPDTRELLKSHKDPIVRANAARLLGAAEDKEALDLLITAAANDRDSRVRVSAIRSLAQLKDHKSAPTLIARGNTLLADYKRSKFASPIEKNELLEVASALGRLKQDTADTESIKFLSAFGEADRYRSPETE
ncbi:MAG TPA: HEAT repeat domain-containing protein, partial [Pyrinomonadaceae bacterium]|nr:HEAT repeat domain-containing protein [Pyrinomonadaceae bacterium]